MEENVMFAISPLLHRKLLEFLHELPYKHVAPLIESLRSAKPVRINDDGSNTVDNGV